jgi:hypothetical protein
MMVKVEVCAAAVPENVEGGAAGDGHIVYVPHSDVEPAAGCGGGAEWMRGSEWQRVGQGQRGAAQVSKGNGCAGWDQAGSGQASSLFSHYSFSSPTSSSTDSEAANTAGVACLSIMLAWPSHTLMGWCPFSRASPLTRRAVTPTVTSAGDGEAGGTGRKAGGSQGERQAASQAGRQATIQRRCQLHIHPADCNQPPPPACTALHTRPTCDGGAVDPREEDSVVRIEDADLQRGGNFGSVSRG